MSGFYERYCISTLCGVHNSNQSPLSSPFSLPVFPFSSSTPHLHHTAVSTLAWSYFNCINRDIYLIWSQISNRMMIFGEKILWSISNTPEHFGLFLGFSVLPVTGRRKAVHWLKQMSVKLEITLPCLADSLGTMDPF